LVGDFICTPMHTSFMSYMHVQDKTGENPRSIVPIPSQNKVFRRNFTHESMSFSELQITV